MFELPGEFSIYKCANCGLLRLYPRLTSKKLSRYYPSTEYYSYTKGVKPGPLWRLRTYLVEKRSILSKLLNLFIHVPAMPLFTEHGRIMDVGCGTGETLVQLGKLGWRTYGVDIDKNAIRIAHERGLSHVQLGSYKSLEKYADNFFDVIRLYHVIEHLDNPDEFLRLAYRKLKIGGELIIGTPNADSLLAKLSGTYWYNLDSPRHLYLFTPDTLKRLLSVHGFSIKLIDYCSIGGIVGSMQYFLRERSGVRKAFIQNVWAILLFYPLERITDWFKRGDVFIIHANK